MNFAISDLRERPEFFDAVADRIWRAWWEPRGFLLDDIRERLVENLRDTGVPIALVAWRDAQFLGTASVIASDLEELPEYTPWVAAVWVEPFARHRRIGRALVSHARDAAFEQGHDPVYLCARPAMRSYYVGIGWKPIEDNVGDQRLTVFIQVKAVDASQALGSARACRG